MRAGRMLVAVVVVALAAMAPLGVTQARGDVLCEAEPQIVKGVETCLSPYPVESELVASSGAVLFSGAAFKVQCGSTLVVKTSKNLGAGKGLAASVTKWTFAGCGGSCSSVSLSGTPYAALISATKEGDGVLTYDVTGDLTFSACTMFKVPCVYDALSDVVLGIAPLAYIGSNGMPFVPVDESSPCPEELTFSGSYEIEQPKGPVFVSRT